MNMLDKDFRLIPEEIADYAIQHSSKESSLLYELKRATHLRTVYPRMVSGHELGLLLSMFSHMLRPSAILEIGTFTAYSAICLASGLSEQGRLHTVEVKPEYYEMAAGFLERAGLKEKVIQHLGSGLDIIDSLDLTFDLAFIDADKVSYLKYYQKIKRKMRKGGFILADNVLWDAQVLDEDASKETEAIKEFNKYVVADAEVENLLLPVRDGLMIARVI